MDISRRTCLAALGALTGAAPLAPLAAQAAAASRPSLPDKTSFDVGGKTFLDSGTAHPFSRGAKAALAAYSEARAKPGSGRASVPTERIMKNFAQLVNADPSELAFVQSTTTAEHMIVDALELFDSDAHIVTDTLHFFGSFPLYEGLADRGARVTWLRPRDGRISLEDMKQAIGPKTKFVALSLVSTLNGFEHDLAKVCELAHAQGAMVYADIVHAAGCVPVDLKASGVDFAACSSYKWLMGDFGLGFVYARKEAQQRLKRKRYGYYGVSSFQTHAFPFDPPGTRVADVEMRNDATGHFATGTYSHSTAIHLDHSLSYLLELGVDRINQHARTLTDRLKAELPRLGYQLLTPLEARAPIVTCALENARSIAPRLEQAGIEITVSRNRFRVTPSVFNDMADIEHLLRTLGKLS